MATQIKYVPRGESTTITVDLTTIFGGLTLLRGFDIPRASTSITIGGKKRSVIHDRWFQYTLEAQALSRSADPDGWAKVATLVGHINQGGEFILEVDSTDTGDTTLNGNVTAGDTTATLTSTTGFADGDLVLIEDANDPTKWELNQINSASGTTLQNPVAYSYATASVFRHWEYFPKCIATDEADWYERRAGEGANLWDLRIDFRTVR